MLNFDFRKKRTKLPELGSWGGGLGNSGNARKKTFFFHWRLPLFILNVSKTQGTAWYTKLKYGPMVEFGNLLNYTAMGVGNHDFDDSVEGFVPFAEQVVTYICIWLK